MPQKSLNQLNSTYMLYIVFTFCRKPKKHYFAKKNLFMASNLFYFCHLRPKTLVSNDTN